MNATAAHFATASSARISQEKAGSGGANRGADAAGDRQSSYASAQAEQRARVADERIKIGKHLNAKA